MSAQTRHRVVVITSWIFTVSAAVLFLQALADALPKHAIDAEWPAHARFHVVTGAAFQACCSVLVVLIARIPFLRGDRWSWYALMIYTIGFAMHIPATIWQGSGPPAGAWYLIGAMMILMSLSLVLCWRYFDAD